MNRIFTGILVLLFGGCSNNLSPEQQRRYEERLSKTQAAISGWIMKYAKYPESYESVSFSEFSETATLRHNEKIPGSENYSIKHIHKMLDKDSNMTTFSGYFILEHDYFVSIIETTRSNAIGGAFPPKISVWTDRFGRTLNAKDSAEFESRQQHENKQLIKKIRKGLESGEMYTEDPKGEMILQELIDSLEKI